MTAEATLKGINLLKCLYNSFTLLFCPFWLSLFVQVLSEGPVTHWLRTYRRLSSRSHSHNFPVARVAGNFLTRPGIDPGTSRTVSEHSTGFEFTDCPLVRD